MPHSFAKDSLNTAIGIDDKADQDCNENLADLMKRLLVLFEGTVSQDSFSDFLQPGKEDTLSVAFITALQTYTQDIHSRVEELDNKLSERTDELASADRILA